MAQPNVSPDVAQLLSITIIDNHSPSPSSETTAHLYSSADSPYLLRVLGQNPVPVPQAPPDTGSRVSLPMNNGTNSLLDIAPRPRLDPSSCDGPQKKKKNTYNFPSCANSTRKQHSSTSNSNTRHISAGFRANYGTSLISTST